MSGQCRCCSAVCVTMKKVPDVCVCHNEKKCQTCVCVCVSRVCLYVYVFVCACVRVCLLGAHVRVHACV